MLVINKYNYVILDIILNNSEQLIIILIFFQYPFLSNSFFFNIGQFV